MRQLLVLVALLFAVPAHGAHFVPLGDLPGGIFESSATGISAEGSVVVGTSQSASGIEAFRWTNSGGMVGLPGPITSEEIGDTGAAGVSADGRRSWAPGSAPWVRERSAGRVTRVTRVTTEWSASALSPSTKTALGGAMALASPPTDRRSWAPASAVRCTKHSSGRAPAEWLASAISPAGCSEAPPRASPPTARRSWAKAPTRRAEPPSSGTK